MRSLTLTGAVVLMGALLTNCVSESTPTDSNAASLTLTAAPAIGLSPTSLSFIYYRRSGLLVPAIQKVHIANTGGRTLTWAATGRRWLRVQPRTGTAPSTLRVSVDLAALGIGINGARPTLLRESITVSAVQASNTPQTIPVTLFIRYY